MENEEWNRPTVILGNNSNGNKDEYSKTVMLKDRYNEETSDDTEKYSNVEMKKKKPVFLVVGIVALLVIVVAVVIMVVAKASVSDGESYEDKLNLGRKCVSELNYGQAIAVYEEAIRIDPKNRKAYIALAELYAEMGDDNKAAEVFKRAEDKIDDEDDLEIIAKKKQAVMASIGRENEEKASGNTDEVTKVVEANISTDNLTEESSDNSEEKKADNNDNPADDKDDFDDQHIEEIEDANDKEDNELAEKLSKYKEYDASKRIISLTASSTLIEENYNHDVINIFDDNRDLCWCEGIKDSTGNGEYIEIKFDDRIYVSSINIFNGYSKNEKSFVDNGKVNVVSVSYENGSTEFQLNKLDWTDVKKREYTDIIKFDNPVYTDFLIIQIKEGAAGEKYKDICISRIEINALGNKKDRKVDTGFFNGIDDDNNADLYVATPDITLVSINNGTGVKIIIGKTKGAEGYTLWMTERKNAYTDYFSFTDYLNGHERLIAEIKKDGRKEREYIIKGLPKGHYEFKVTAYKINQEIDTDLDIDNKIYAESKEKGIDIKAFTTKASNDISYDYKKIKSGDIISFGHYEQDGIMDNGKEKIEWIVLTKEKNSLFLMSKSVLDCLPYSSEGWVDTDWENCKLRKWLNDEFYNTAFSSDEKNMIITTLLTNNDSEEYGTDGGNSTYDNVFLLSYDDVTNSEYGFDDEPKEEDFERCCTATPFARIQGTCYVGSADGSDYYDKSDEVGWCQWWIRSPGQSAVSAALVDYYGYVDGFGRVAYFNDIGVRPAIYISLD